MFSTIVLIINREHTSIDLLLCKFGSGNSLTEANSLQVTLISVKLTKIN